MKKILPSFLFIFSAVIGKAQSDHMDFEKYNPNTILVVPEHKLTRAKFPFIDVHNHQFEMPDQNLNDLVKDMDKMQMAVMVNLSGQSGNILKKSIANVKATAPTRFIVFANIDFAGIGENGWTAKTVKQLEDDVKNGANGLK